MPLFARLTFASTPDRRARVLNEPSPTTQPANSDGSATTDGLGRRTSA